MATHSPDTATPRYIPLPDSSRPWLAPITGTDHTVYEANASCHKTLGEALADAKHEATETDSPAREAAEPPNVKGVKQNGQGVTGSY